MVAIQPIPKGHEIFNTYGQMANWQLIHMYGFAEPYPNVNDTADIQMVTVREAALQGEWFNSDTGVCVSIPAPFLWTKEKGGFGFTRTFTLVLFYL